MSVRKWQREVVAIAREIGIEDVQVVYKGRHPHILGTYQGRMVNRAFAGTPSDSRFARTKTRRALERAVGL